MVSAVDIEGGLPCYGGQRVTLSLRGVNMGFKTEFILNDCMYCVAHIDYRQFVVGENGSGTNQYWVLKANTDYDILHMAIKID